MTQRRAIDPNDYPDYFQRSKNAMIIKLPNTRLSFPELFEAKPFKPGDTPKFKATFLIPKGSQLHKEVEAAILEVATTKWGAKGKAIIDGIRNNPNKFCFQDGATKSYDGYQGMMALSANNIKRPLVVDRDKTTLVAADGRPYAGCYVHGSVELFAYNNTGNGISASLRGVQFYKDGDAFSGGAPADESEFDDLSEGADAESLV